MVAPGLWKRSHLVFVRAGKFGFTTVNAIQYDRSPDELITVRDQLAFESQVDSFRTPHLQHIHIECVTEDWPEWPWV